MRKASADIVDLNGMRLNCSQDVLDGFTFQVEAMVNGARVILEAEDPDERTGDACRRVWVLEQLLWNATSRRK